MAHGGYRRPTNPAPVSGPGAMSKRTDGRQPMMDLPNAAYGENAAFRNAQAAAPMAESAGGMGALGALGPDLSSIVGMGAPSQFPDEPITAGMPMGPGAGGTAGSARGTMSPEMADRLRSYLPVLVTLASRDEATPQTRAFVRKMRAELG